MKPNKHTINFLLALAVSVVLMTPGCELKETADPNNPSMEGVLDNASVPVLNTIVTGTESGMRLNLEFYLDDVGAVGRELYRFSTADPRYTGDLLGRGNAILDNNTFYITNPWNAFYRVVKNTNILIQAVNNTGQPTEEQKQGYLGFANTIKAYALLLALNLTNENGIRVDVADPDNIGPIVDKPTALTAIAQLLDEGAAQLDSAGAAFAFQLSAGFTGFNTPETFRRFNRGLASRVALYREDFPAALALVQESFLVLGNYNATKDIGAYHIYSNAGGDELNRFFLPLNSTGEVRGAHASFVEDAVAAGEGNDLRIAEKVALRSIPSTLDNLTAVYGVTLYGSNLDPVPILRNEELMLIYAEASIRTGALQQGLDVLNQIRTGNGLAPYAGPVTGEALIDEMLKQRRYSLFMEGHRWIDMRRYGRLNELPLDRTGDDVWESFPIPFAENES
ncbi:MAG TPA: RagB/SusD family nutrient uptake outer membrane protein [Sphingobacteriaceae bacterium]